MVRYAALKADGEGGARAAATATPAPAAAPAASPPAAAALPEPGTVMRIFGDADLADVSAAAGGRLVVVEAGLSWCRPCKRFAPAYAAFAQSYRGVVFLKFNGDSNAATKHLFKDILHVPQTPSFAFFRGGVQVGGLHTGANAAKLLAALQERVTAEEDPLHGAPEYQRRAFGAGLAAGNPLTLA